MCRGHAPLPRRKAHVAGMQVRACLCGAPSTVVPWFTKGASPFNHAHCLKTVSFDCSSLCRLRNAGGSRRICRSLSGRFLHHRGQLGSRGSPLKVKMPHCFLQCNLCGEAPTDASGHLAPGGLVIFPEPIKGATAVGEAVVQCRVCIVESCVQRHHGHHLLLLIGDQESTSPSPGVTQNAELPIVLHCCLDVHGHFFINFQTDTSAQGDGVLLFWHRL